MPAGIPTWKQELGMGPSHYSPIGQCSRQSAQGLLLGSSTGGGFFCSSNGKFTKIDCDQIIGPNSHYTHHSLLPLPLPDTTPGYIDLVLCKSSPWPLVFPSPLEIVVRLMPWQTHWSSLPHHISKLGGYQAGLLLNCPSPPALHAHDLHSPPSCPRVLPRHQVVRHAWQG